MKHKIIGLALGSMMVMGAAAAQDTKSVKPSITAETALGNDAETNKTVQASDANTYGSTRSNKEGITADVGADVSEEDEIAPCGGGHVTLVRSAETGASDAPGDDEAAPCGGGGGGDTSLTGHVTLVRVAGPNSTGTDADDEADSDTPAPTAVDPANHNTVRSNRKRSG